MIAEINIHAKQGLGMILAQDDEAIFIPEKAIPKVAQIINLAQDGLEFTADVEYLQLINDNDGLAIFDGKEAIYCQNHKLGRFYKAVVA
jgi:hypothetical protein